MSVRCRLFQVDYPKLVASKVIISVSEGARADLKIILHGLSFLNSHWIFYNANLQMINCHAAYLALKLKDATHAIIQNCTFGDWSFVQVQDIFIKSCNNVFYEDNSTSLKFYNSSASLANITIEHEIITGDQNGIFIYNYSLLRAEQSKFVNNTVERGIIKTLKSSSLIMSNCTVLENHATGYPGVIYANESFVYLKNTEFNGNKAINGGGAILIEHLSFLHIKNCTFKNNSVDRAMGIGGAIVSQKTSLLDFSFSKFEYNKAYLGGALYQQNSSKTKLNQCLFFGNSETAVVGLYKCKISIMNSIFQNNLAKDNGGAVAVAERSFLNVSNTTFESNAQISASTLNVYQYPYTEISKEEGEGGAIVLSKSVGNISKSCFRNNSATYWCGTITAVSNSLLSISDTSFENNVADQFGGVLCNDNSFMNIKYSKF